MSFSPFFLIILIKMRKGHVPVQKPLESIKQSKATTFLEFEWIADIAQQFTEQVQKPLQIRQSLIKNAEPQRCLVHNIAYSIYCTICRKVLCASCMYTTPQHRKHRVVPIQNASEQLRQDLKTFQSKILKVGNQAESLIDSNGQILMKIEKQYNPLVIKLKEFYQSLRNFLKKKQRQQLKQLKEIKDMATAQVSQYNSELGKINQVVMSKLLECTKQNYKYPQPLAPRSILQTVMQASNFINETALDGEKFKFPTDIDKIAASETEIEWKINTIFNTFETPKRNARSIEIKRSQSKSPAKKVSFTQTRLKLQQIPNKQDRLFKHKKNSMSNIARRSQFHKL